VHGRADGLANTAAGAVGASEIVAFDDKFVPGDGIEQPRHDRVSTLFKGQVLAVKAHHDTGQALRVGAQHFFKCILGNPLAVLRIQRALAGGAVKGILQGRQSGAAQAGNESNIGGVVDPQRRSRGQLVRNAPAPQVLPGAHMGALGTG
jgi:hypothetical protein